MRTRERGIISSKYSFQSGVKNDRKQEVSQKTLVQEALHFFFYIRTNFIRTASLKLDQKLRTT